MTIITGGDDRNVDNYEERGLRSEQRSKKDKVSATAGLFAKPNDEQLSVVEEAIQDSKMTLD